MQANVFPAAMDVKPAIKVNALAAYQDLQTAFLASHAFRDV